MLEPLRRGIVVEGERFQPMTVTLDRQQGANAWLTVAIREGRNREVRRAMEAVGLAVNRLIRIGYGPFRLGELPPARSRRSRRGSLRDQLGLTEPANAGASPAPAKPGGRKTRPPGSRNAGTGPRRGAAAGESSPETRPDRPKGRGKPSAPAGGGAKPPRQRPGGPGVGAEAWRAQGPRGGRPGEPAPQARRQGTPPAPRTLRRPAREAAPRWRGRRPPRGARHRRHGPRACAD